MNKITEASLIPPRAGSFPARQLVNIAATTA